MSKSVGGCCTKHRELKTICEKLLAVEDELTETTKRREALPGIRVVQDRLVLAMEIRGKELKHLKRSRALIKEIGKLVRG